MDWRTDGLSRPGRGGWRYCAVTAVSLDSRVYPPTLFRVAVFATAAAAIRYDGGRIEAVGGHFFACAVDVVLSVRFALSNRDPTGR